MGLGRDACYQLLKCVLHNSLRLLTPTFRKQNLLGWLGFSPTFGKDSDGEVAIKQLAAVVDVIFVHMRIRKYPISLGAHEIHQSKITIESVAL